MPPPPPPSSSSSLDDILPALHHALSGATGTAISTCTTYPLSLVLTRLQVQRQLARDGVLAPDEEYTGIADAFSRISAGAAEEGGGLKALYTGLTQDVTKSVLDSFLFFLFYELIQSRAAGTRAARDRGRGLGVAGELAVGVAAGACSRALTTPLSNIVARKQTAALLGDGDGDALTVRSLAAAIYREKGLVRGFWSGYSASLVLTLNPALTFFLQEALRRALAAPDPSARATFLLAAVSKAVASAVTYPFQTAKARLQVAAPDDEGQGTAAAAAEDADPAETKPADANGSAAAPGDEKGGAEAPPGKEEEEEEEAGDKRAVEKQVEAHLEAVRGQVRQLARRSIFGTMAQIVRAEGVAALYAGLPGELLKGFCSHGTTMLAKGVAHRLLLRLALGLAAVLAALGRRRRRLRLQRAGLEKKTAKKVTTAGPDGTTGGGGRLAGWLLRKIAGDDKDGHGYDVADMIFNMIDCQQRRVGRS